MTLWQRYEKATSGSGTSRAEFRRVGEELAVLATALNREFYPNTREKFFNASGDCRERMRLARKA